MNQSVSNDWRLFALCLQSRRLEKNLLIKAPPPPKGLQKFGQSHQKSLKKIVEKTPVILPSKELVRLTAGHGEEWEGKDEDKSPDEVSFFFFKGTGELESESVPRMGLRAVVKMEAIGRSSRITVGLIKGRNGLLHKGRGRSHRPAAIFIHETAPFHVVSPFIAEAFHVLHS